MSKNHTPLCLLLNFCTAEHFVSINNKWSAWAADNLAPVHMLFLSIKA